MAQNHHIGETKTTRANVSIASIKNDIPLSMETTPLLGTMVGSIPIVVDEPYEGDPSQYAHLDPPLT